MVFVSIVFIDIYGLGLHSLAFGHRITSPILSCHVSLLVIAFMSLQYLLISMVKAITATSNFSKLILPSVLIGKGFVCILLMEIYGQGLHSLAFGHRITSLILSCHVSLLVNAFMSLYYLLISMVKALTARN
jgi:hypothetical protein